MAKRRKKSKKKTGRKNPKRVAAGRKAARARWGTGAKKTSRNVSKVAKKSVKKKAAAIVKLAHSISKSV
jgi:hypothetical protein